MANGIIRARKGIKRMKIMKRIRKIPVLLFEEIRAAGEAEMKRIITSSFCK